MFKRILVPLDGSALADRALAYAATLAGLSQAEVHLVRAVDTWHLVDGSRSGQKEAELTAEAERALGAAEAKLRTAGVAASSTVQLGEASAVIAAGQRSQGSDLIVMSTHGRGGLARLAYGSVAERVLRLGECPVLLIPPEAADDWPGAPSGTILVPLDGSALALEAIPAAEELGRLFGASLKLLQVIEPPPPLAYDNLAGAAAAAYPYMDVNQWAEEARPYAQAIADGLQSEGHSASAETLIGYAAATIDERARECQALAIVMASHGRSGIARMVLGSVAQGVVQRTTVPVLVIRPMVVREPSAAPLGKEAAAY